MADISVFGADWWPDCRPSKRFLDEQRISYSWVDLDRDPGAKAHVEARFGPRVWGARWRSGGERTRPSEGCVLGRKVPRLSGVGPYLHSPIPRPLPKATDADSHEWVCRHGEPAVVNLTTNTRGGEGIDG